MSFAEAFDVGKNAAYADIARTDSFDPGTLQFHGGTLSRITNGEDTLAMAALGAERWFALSPTEREEVAGRIGAVVRFAMEASEYSQWKGNLLAHSDYRQYRAGRRRHGFVRVTEVMEKGLNHKTIVGVGEGAEKA
ncbi:MAG: hypothetical protein ACXWLH_00805 [Candidatus Saccharimonadales bacterium]